MNFESTNRARNLIFAFFLLPPPRAPPRPHKMAVGAVEIRPLEDDGEGGEKEGEK